MLSKLARNVVCDCVFFCCVVLTGSRRNGSAAWAALHDAGVELLPAGTVEHRTRFPGARHGALLVAHARHARRLDRTHLHAHADVVAAQLAG